MPINNERGSIIVIAVLILALLSIIGVSALKTSITEQQISTNHLIYQMNFYAAESGAPHGILWLNTFNLENDGEKDWFMSDEDGNITSVVEEQEWFSLSNGTSYTWKVQHQVNADGDILYYGDDGKYESGVKVSDVKDHLWEVNTTTGIPLEIIDAEGTHPRGGLARIRTTWIFTPAFEMPAAALWVDSSVDGNGVSGSIIGEHQTGSSCPDVPDIMYDVEGGTIEYNGDMGDSPLIEKSTGMYPMPLIGARLRKIADITITGSNNIDESAVITSESDPGVVVFDGDSKATNLTGYGILYVDGNLELAGSLDWHGVILVSGNITLSGGGTKTIYGAIVGMGNAIAINGSVDIQYDCELLTDLFDKYASYRMTSWRQM